MDSAYPCALPFAPRRARSIIPPAFFIEPKGSHRVLHTPDKAKGPTRGPFALLAEREGLLGLRPRPSGRRRCATTICAACGGLSNHQFDFLGFESNRTHKLERPHAGALGFIGGEGGIRTLVTRKRKHDFESCAFNHSATSPICSSPPVSRSACPVPCPHHRAQPTFAAIPGMAPCIQGRRAVGGATRTTSHAPRILPQALTSRTSLSRSQSMTVSNFTWQSSGKAWETIQT